MSNLIRRLHDLDQGVAVSPSDGVDPPYCFFRNENDVRGVTWFGMVKGDKGFCLAYTFEGKNKTRVSKDPTDEERAE